MAVQTLEWEHERYEMGQIAEKGLSSWFLAADARIKTQTNPVGIGPVVYKGPLKNSENVVSKDGYSRDMVCFFYTADGVLRAELFNQEPGDINDTINAFLVAHGGDTSIMLNQAPVIE